MLWTRCFGKVLRLLNHTPTPSPEPKREPNFDPEPKLEPNFDPKLDSGVTFLDYKDPTYVNIVST